MRTLGCLLALATLSSGCFGSADKVAADPPAAGSAHHRKHADRRTPRTPMVADAPPLTLDVVVGGTTTTWHPDAFARVAEYAVNQDGSRNVWSLRDLVHQLVGPTARVAEVSGPEGGQVIDPAIWADPQRTPLLHTTRRGTLRFRWADAAGTWGEAAVKDVTRIELAR